MDWSELEAVYGRYHQQLYRYCFSIVGNAEDAQDALQNAMVKAVRALPGEQREIQLKPWLYRIAHNESIELLRKRRESVELDAKLASPAGGPAETAAQRERLRQLIGDLAHLPERQRGALVMRELSGLGFEQIGEAFGTSPAVARQTVYEGRLSLRQLEAGREMGCEKAMRELSDADGRVTRRRDIQAHLRTCAECRAFGESIAKRRRDLAAIAPLPAAASSALLHSLLGGGKASAGLGGSVAAGVGKTAATSVAVKSAATVAVVAVLGASVADRSGLIDISDRGRGKADSERVSGAGSSQPAGRSEEATGGRAAVRDARAEGDRNGAPPSVGPSSARANPGRSSGAETGQGRPSSPTNGPTKDQLPAASNHGQETAAAHGGGQAQAGSRRADGTSKGHQKARSHSPSSPQGQAKGHSKPGGQAKSNGQARGNSKSAGQAKGHPESAGQAKGNSQPPAKSKAHLDGGSGTKADAPSPPPAAGEVRPDNAPQAPLQPSENP